MTVPIDDGSYASNDPGSTMATQAVVPVDGGTYASNDPGSATAILTRGWLVRTVPDPIPLARVIEADEANVVQPAMERTRATVMVNVDTFAFAREFSYGAIDVIPTPGGGDGDPGTVKPRPTVGLLFPAR